MTTNISHANCSHPKTPAARSACRKAMRKGQTYTAPLTSAPVIERIDLPMTHLSTDGHMGLNDAQRITQDLLRQHGLDTWTVTFDMQRRRAGACFYNRRQISLSRPLMAQRSWADTMMTITHEIAHALTPGEKHSPVWAAKHRELGGNGLRCFDHFDETAPWIGICAAGNAHPKYKAPKRPDAQYRCKCPGTRGLSFTFERNPNA